MWHRPWAVPQPSFGIREVTSCREHNLRVDAGDDHGQDCVDDAAEIRVAGLRVDASRRQRSDEQKEDRQEQVVDDARVSGAEHVVDTRDHEPRPAGAGHQCRHGGGHGGEDQDVDDLVPAVRRVVVHAVHEDRRDHIADQEDRQDLEHLDDLVGRERDDAPVQERKVRLEEVLRAPHQQQGSAGDSQRQHDRLEQVEDRGLDVDLIKIHAVLLGEAVIPDERHQTGEHGRNGKHRGGEQRLSLAEERADVRVDAQIVERQSADGREQSRDDEAAPSPAFAARMGCGDSHDGFAAGRAAEQRHAGEPQGKEHDEQEHAEEADRASDHAQRVDAVGALERGVHVERAGHELDCVRGGPGLEQLRSVEAILHVDDAGRFLAVDGLRIPFAAHTVRRGGIGRDAEVEERLGVVVLEIIGVRQHLAGRLVGFLEGILVELAGDDADVTVPVIVEVFAIVLGRGLRGRGLAGHIAERLGFVVLVDGVTTDVQDCLDQRSLGLVVKEDGLMDGVTAAGLAGHADLVLVDERKRGRILDGVVQAAPVDKPVGVVEDLRVTHAVQVEGQDDETTPRPFDLIVVPLFLHAVAAMREHDGGCGCLVGGGVGLEHVDAQTVTGG